jgi:hypothetical protein
VKFGGRIGELNKAFMERWERPMYVSNGVLSKLYHAALQHEENADHV